MPQSGNTLSRQLSPPRLRTPGSPTPRFSFASHAIDDDISDISGDDSEYDDSEYDEATGSGDAGNSYGGGGSASRSYEDSGASSADGASSSAGASGSSNDDASTPDAADTASRRLEDPMRDSPYLTPRSARPPPVRTTPRSGLSSAGSTAIVVGAASPVTLSETKSWLLAEQDGLGGLAMAAGTALPTDGIVSPTGGVSSSASPTAANLPGGLLSPLARHGSLLSPLASARGAAAVGDLLGGALSPSSSLRSAGSASIVVATGNEADLIASLASPTAAVNPTAGSGPFAASATSAGQPVSRSGSFLGQQPAGPPVARSASSLSQQASASPKAHRLPGPLLASCDGSPADTPRSAELQARLQGAGRAVAAAKAAVNAALSATNSRAPSGVLSADAIPADAYAAVAQHMSSRRTSRDNGGGSGSLSAAASLAAVPAASATPLRGAAIDSASSSPSAVDAEAWADRSCPAADAFAAALPPRAANGGLKPLRSLDASKAASAASGGTLGDASERHSALAALHSEIDDILSAYTLPTAPPAAPEVPGSAAAVPFALQTASGGDLPVLPLRLLPQRGANGHGGSASPEGARK